MFTLHSSITKNVIQKTFYVPFSLNYFSQKKKEQLAECIERRKVIKYFKNIFTSNMELFTELSPSLSAQTNTQILKNMGYLSIDNPKLHQTIKRKYHQTFYFLRISFKLHVVIFLMLLSLVSLNQALYQQTLEKKLLSEINPQLALMLEGDESRLLKLLSDYFKNFFYLFDYEELKSVEYIYMQSGKHIPLSFNASLENEVSFKKAKIRTMNIIHTKNMVEHMKIEMPKGINVVFSKDDNRVQLNFPALKQNLIIYGVEHGDYKQILEMKELLLKDQSTRHFILEQPPMQYSEFQETIEQGETNRDEKLKQMLFGGSTFTGSSDRKESVDPDQILKYYRQVPILKGDMSRFYIEQYLLKQKNYYRLNDVERIIYTEEDGLAKPQEFATFIYNQMSRDKRNESQILLADLTIEDEIYHQIQTKNNDEIKKQFDLFKIISINEQIDWAIRVGKSGCPACSQGTKRGPNDIINSCGDNDYDFSLREINLAKQALHFMKVNKDAEKFIMFVGHGHLQNVMKEILKLYNEEQFKKEQKQLTTIHEYIEDFQSVKMKTDFQKQNNNLEFLNKFSLYSTYFKTNRNLLPTELRSAQNQKDYSYFRSQYQQQLHPDNFINQAQRWQDQKGQDKCFALKLLKLA